MPGRPVIPAIASISVPPVVTNGLSVPTRASPIAWVAAMSESTAPMKSPVRIASCLKARWITPSASAAAWPETVEVVEIAAADLGAEGGDGLSGCVRAGQADDLVAVVQQFGDDGGGDVA